ncbi:DUF1156 domain-containing protein [Nitratidesulfovibrio liaohensis]|uniref:DUF1156 domain-containing protein n=1 Tax=Nitratidesulfovibrio liaohensis TaxID=2604158 RepID=UPI001424A3F2|nr:DUF1156 domain-containing protein [Nitratidesulfovibrio liaohensis]
MLDKINAAAREKSIRYGHPNTLHIWWASISDRQALFWIRQSCVSRVDEKCTSLSCPFCQYKL